MWRKNRRKGTTCDGVDLNRNFPDHWAEVISFWGGSVGEGRKEKIVSLFIILTGGPDPDLERPLSCAVNHLKKKVFPPCF